MKIILIIISLFLTQLIFAQEDSSAFHWRSLDTIPLPKNAKWSMDIIGNHYIGDGNVLYKIDTAGVEKFRQSIKSFGKNYVTQSINSMKLLLFSSDQQSICFFDNTLTKSETCLNLSDYNIEYASLISASSRPEKIWVFDDVNSRLLLLDTESNKIQLELTNILANFGITELLKMEEVGNRLYLFDKAKGTIILDLFGTLINKIETKDLEDAKVVDQTILILSSDTLTIYSENSETPGIIALPIEGIEAFYVKDDLFFFKTKNAVHKFRFEF